MRASTVVRPERIHRGVVICNIDDILPDGWADWMDIPTWPETVEETFCGLGPRRWATLADRAKTLQEQQVARQLGEYSSIAKIAATMGLSVKRVTQLAKQLLDRVAKPKTQVQVDMFDDKDDGGES